MGSVIKKTSSLSGPAGLLKKMAIQSIDVVEVYRLPKDSEISYLSIRIVNPSATEDVNVKLWIGSSGKSPQLADLIEPLLAFGPNDIYISEGLSLSSGESLFIQTDKIPVVIRVEGYNNVVPI